MTKFLFAAALLSLVVLLVNCQNSCPLPPRFKFDYDFRWQSRSHEWINNSTKTDYLALALSWTPTFCENLPNDTREREFQCQHLNYFGMVVHGLWPQVAHPTSVRDHPRNCRDDGQLNATLVKRYFCLMPDEDLIQSQWEKHGSCYYRTAAEYYAIMEKIYLTLKIPDLRSIKVPTVSNVKAAFLAVNPSLFSSALSVSFDQMNRLKEVKICYNLKYALISCP